MRYTCYFDGACAPINPFGHMGIGAVIFCNEDIYFSNAHYIEEGESNSNNVAEYIAFQSILEELLPVVKLNDNVIIHGDSKLVVNQMKDYWGIKNGLYVEHALEAKELFNELKTKCNLHLKWIPREQNTIADELSNKGFIERGIKQFKK